MTYRGYHGRTTINEYIYTVNVDGTEKRYTTDRYATYKEILKKVYNREKCTKAWVVKMEHNYFEE